MAIKECVICGLLFEHQNYNIKTCSLVCRRTKDSERKRKNNKEKRKDKEYSKFLTRKVLEWKRTKRASDPEWAKKESKRSAEFQRQKRINNQEWAMRQNEKCRVYYNSQSAAASMLNLMGTMIQINERGLSNETDQPE